MTFNFSHRIQLLAAALALLLASCGGPEIAIATSSNLQLIGEHCLAIEEPSGLSLSSDGNTLWTVSDADGHAYQIDFNGNVLASFDTGLRDLEGIATIDETTLAVLAEREREIVVFSTDGSILRRGKIDLPGSDNNGPEGLAYESVNGGFVTVKESPGILIRMDSNFKEVSRKTLGFARDYSSIFHEPDRDELWVMSDQSGTIHVLDNQFRIQTAFSTNIRQLEGVAIDRRTRRIYMVSDPLARLYIFEFTEE